MRLSRTTYTLFLLLIVSSLVMGCDSNGDDDPAPDAERFIGEWSVVSASDQGGSRDQTTVFSSLGVLSLNFNETDFSLLLVYTDTSTEDLSVSGPYSVAESSGTITLTVTVEGFGSVPLAFDYEFASDDEVQLSGDSAVLDLILGAGLEGVVVLTLQRV